jgi:hypothetical protein
MFGEKRDTKRGTDAVKKHKQNYKDDDDDAADEKSLGAAAAMQALKMFNQGETGGKQSKGAFLGLAMSEASKVSFFLSSNPCADGFLSY